MGMTLNHQMEQFGRAYVHAVATVAGFKVFPPASPDDDSVDLSIGARGAMGTIRSPKIDVQLKCTTREVEGNVIKYELSLKNYDDLRHEDFQVPRILVVVVVPPEVEDWIDQTPAQLVLRRCGYWLSLRGMPETDNRRSVTVSIPTENVFSVPALQEMLARIGKGGTP